MAEALLRRSSGGGIGGNLKTVIYTMNTQFTAPITGNYFVRIVGGGGGSPGGGGGWMNNGIIKLSKGQKVQINIGNGGLPRGSGGTTVFGSYLVAYGGTTGNIYSGGSGGSGGGGEAESNGGIGYQFGGGGAGGTIINKNIKSGEGKYNQCIGGPGGQHGGGGGGRGGGTLVFKGSAILAIGPSAGGKGGCSTGGTGSAGGQGVNTIGKGLEYEGYGYGGSVINDRYMGNTNSTTYPTAIYTGGGGGGGYGGNGGISRASYWFGRSVSNGCSLTVPGGGGGGGYGCNGGNSGIGDITSPGEGGGGGGYGSDGDDANGLFECGGGGGGYSPTGFGHGGTAGINRAYSINSNGTMLANNGAGMYGICIIQYYE